MHALTLRMPLSEIRTKYYERAAGSASKLKTYSDGFRILMTIGNLLRSERPVLFFGTIGLFLLTVSVVISIPLMLTYLETGLVPRLPTGVLAATLAMLAFLSFSVGLILDNVALARREAKRLAYLRHEVASDRARG